MTFVIGGISRGGSQHSVLFLFLFLFFLPFLQLDTSLCQVIFEALGQSG